MVAVLDRTLQRRSPPRCHGAFAAKPVALIPTSRLWCCANASTHVAMQCRVGAPNGVDRYERLIIRALEYW